MSLPNRTFNDIIQNDAFDHIIRNIMSNCDVETIESCRTVSHRFNKLVMEDGHSLDKLIKRIRYMRFLVHPIFKSILEKIEAEGIYDQKKKLAKLLINFNFCEKFELRGVSGYNIINATNSFLGKV